jgi:hypothetical protein
MLQVVGIYVTIIMTNKKYWVLRLTYCLLPKGIYFHNYRLRTHPHPYPCYQPQPNKTSNDIKNIKSNFAPAHFYFVSQVSGIKNILAADTNSSVVAHSSNIHNTLPLLNIYENKDVPENYYSIGFPDSVNVLQGSKPGSFVASSGAYSYNTELQDIPDDSNVELFTLSILFIK